MNLSLAAKSTKPGSKATARRGSVGANGKPQRIPVGTLHYVDTAAQVGAGAMYSALCLESGLVIIDGEPEAFANDCCNECSETRWSADFSEMQARLLSE